MVQDLENCGISYRGVVIRWEVGKGEFLVRVKKGGGGGVEGDRKILCCGGVGGQ